MIIVRAPVRISFVGGGTDLPAFYTQSPGCVISTAINKYSYVVVNRQPLMRGKVSARYSVAESISHARELKNDRIREALLHFGIEHDIDVTTFSEVPINSGLGSSSSFSVALMKALLLLQGKDADQRGVAELASHLEIELVKDPIGKQDQYAAAFGGMKVFRFNSDHSVDVEPIYLDYKKQSALEGHIQLFYTGIARLASSILTEQSANAQKNFNTLKEMADLVPEFKGRLLAGDFQGLGSLLHEGWMKKKTLATNVSNPIIDDFYMAGMNAGAWGGKVIGAGGGGCVMFLAPNERKLAVQNAMATVAKKHNLENSIEIPVRFVHSGVEVLHSNHQDDIPHFE